MSIEEARQISAEESADTSQTEWTASPEFIGRDSATYEKMKAQTERARRAQNYRETPICRKCTWCLVMRELRMGQIVNTAYACTCGRFSVNGDGTCDRGHLGKRGPLVLVRVLKGDSPRTDFKTTIPPNYKAAFRLEQEQLEELEHGSGE